MTQLYRDTHRRGSPLSLLFSTLNVAHASSFLRSLSLSLFYSPLFHSVDPNQMCLPQILRFHRGTRFKLFHGLSRIDVNDACSISQRRVMMKSHHLITRHRSQFSSIALKQLERNSFCAFRCFRDLCVSLSINGRDVRFTIRRIRISSLVLSKVRQHAIHDRNANEKCPDSPIIALITLFPVDR